MNDKTPPGWYLGCDLDLERYSALCEDWKFIQSYGKPSAWTEEDEKAVVIALRMRVKGPAREVLDENKNIRETKKIPPPHGDGPAPDGYIQTYQPGYETLWKTHFTILENNFGKERQKISEKRYEEFLQYSRKRGQTVQEFVSEFNRLHERAKEHGLVMGDLMQGWWFLRQGRFSDEQKRWMLAPPISNDWTKHSEIQQAALKMPEALTGQAHFTEDTAMDAIFMNSAERAVKEWEDAYWEVYHALDQYVYEMENEEEEYDDAEEDETGTAYWECESTAPGSSYEEAWYGSEWNDEDWEEYDAEAYYECDDDGNPIYYDDDAYEEDDDEEDKMDIYLADASDCNTEQDEQECQIYLQHRKLYRQQRRLRPGKGKPYYKRRRPGKGGGKGRYGRYRRRKGWRPKGWRPRPKGSYRKGKFGGGKGSKGKGKGKPGAWLRRPKAYPKRRYKSKAYSALPAFLKKKGAGKGKGKGKGYKGSDGDSWSSSSFPYGPGKGKGN